MLHASIYLLFQSVANWWHVGDKNCHSLNRHSFIEISVILGIKLFLCELFPLFLTTSMADMQITFWLGLAQFIRYNLSAPLCQLKFA